jgi:hypothetical protein
VLPPKPDPGAPPPLPPPLPADLEGFVRLRSAAPTPESREPIPGTEPTPDTGSPFTSVVGAVFREARYNKTATPIPATAILPVSVIYAPTINSNSQRIRGPAAQAEPVLQGERPKLQMADPIRRQSSASP